MVDSRVFLGCWAHGRSSSRALNGVLRSCIPFAAAGRVKGLNIWVGTKHNPSDDPSRKVPICLPVAPTAEVIAFLSEHGARYLSPTASMTHAEAIQPVQPVKPHTTEVTVTSPSQPTVSIKA